MSGYTVRVLDRSAEVVVYQEHVSLDEAAQTAADWIDGEHYVSIKPAFRDPTIVRMFKRKRR